MIFLSILRQDSELATAILQRWRPALSRFAERAFHRLATYALLHDLLTEGMGLAPESYQLTHDGDGRPILRGNNGMTLPAISLSHSAGWVACAASEEGEVGLDVEWAKPPRDYPALAAAAFGPSEIAAVQDDGAAAFYRIWSLREAWAKARGTGLAAVADRRDRVPLLSKPGQIATVIDGEPWLWQAEEPLPGLHVSLAWRRWQANHSTIPLRKCHVSPELTFSETAFSAGSQER